MKRFVIGALLSLFAFTLSAFAQAASVSPETARKIMGRNFFGVEDAERYFHAKPTESQRSALARIPFFEATLLRCQSTHLLIAVLRLSVADIRARVDSTLFDNNADAFMFERSGRYDGQDWDNHSEVEMTHNRGEVGWQLIRKIPIPERKITKDEDVPGIRVLIYAIIAYRLSTHKSLFGDESVLSLGSGRSSGVRYYVSFSDSDGVRIGGVRVDRIPENNPMISAVTRKPGR